METSSLQKKLYRLAIFKNKYLLKLVPILLFTLLSACETPSEPQQESTQAVKKIVQKQTVQEKLVVPDIWFDRVSTHAIPNAVSSKKLCKYISQKLTTKSGQFPTELESDHLPRIIFASISTSAEKTATVEYGTGKGFKLAVTNLLSKLDDIHTIHQLKLDIVLSVEVEEHFTIKKYSEPSASSRKANRHTATTIDQPSLQGIAFTQKSGLAFLNSELKNRGFVDGKNRIMTSTIAAHLNTVNTTNSKALTKVWQYISKLKSQTVYLFKTRSYVLKGDSFQKVFRNHTIQKRLTLEKLQNVQQTAQKYLTSQINSKGQVKSYYNPSNSYSELGDTIESPLMTLSALLSLKRATPGLTPAIKVLIKKYFRPHPKKQTIGAITDETTVNLETNAKVLRVLLKYQRLTQQGQFNEQIRLLSSYVKKQQHKNGAFIKDRMWDKGTILKTNNHFFPGQVLQALLDLYEYKGDKAALKVAEKYLRYLIPRIGDSYFQFCADPELVTATVRLQNLTNSNKYQKFTIGMGNALIAHQNSEAKDLDALGSFQTPHNVYYSAEACRALTNLYKQLAKVRTDRRFMSRLQDTIVLANLYLLQSSLDSIGTMYFPKPQDALGGFHNNLSDPTINSDTVCATLKSLNSTISLLKLLQLKELPTSVTGGAYDTLLENHNYINEL